MRHVLVAIALGAALETRASAQPTLKGSVAAGVTVGRAVPTADALSTGARLRPTLRRLPSRGIGFAFALNWFDAAVDETFASTDRPLGRLWIRPVMFGMAYTAVHNRLAIAPSIVAGPALSSLRIDEPLKGSYSIGGNAVERNAGTISAAVRAGVNVTYAVAPRLGLTTFGGYLWHRPEFTVVGPAGETRKRLRADAVVFNAGVIVSLF